MDLISRSTVTTDFFHFSSLPMYIQILYIRQTANRVVCDTLKNEWSRFTQFLQFLSIVFPLLYFNIDVCIDVKFRFSAAEYSAYFFHPDAHILSMMGNQARYGDMCWAMERWCSLGALYSWHYYWKKLQKFARVSSDVRVSNPESAHSTAIHCCRLLKM